MVIEFHGHRSSTIQQKLLILFGPCLYLKWTGEAPAGTDYEIHFILLKWESYS